MITKRIVVEIKIDEKVADLYPDYNIFFDDIADFTNHVISNIETEKRDTYEDLGYSIRVMEAHDFDHLVTFSKN